MNKLMLFLLSLLLTYCFVTCDASTHKQKALRAHHPALRSSVLVQTTILSLCVVELPSDILLYRCTKNTAEELALHILFEYLALPPSVLLQPTKDIHTEVLVSRIVRSIVIFISFDTDKSTFELEIVFRTTSTGERERLWKTTPVRSIYYLKQNMILFTILRYLIVVVKKKKSSHHKLRILYGPALCIVDIKLSSWKTNLSLVLCYPLSGFLCGHM